MNYQPTHFAQAGKAVVPGYGRRQIQMTPLQWAAIPDHPSQRNTDARVERAAKTHLGNTSPFHAEVKMAQYPDGSCVKLDGHTRALAWARGLAQPPQVVNVDIYPVANDQEAIELYTHLDSPHAVEKTSDRSYGAGRYAGLKNINLNWYSSMGRFGMPARLASSYRAGNSTLVKSYTENIAVKHHIDAIDDLIDFNPRLSIMLTPLQTAYILTFEKHGKAKCRAFWTAYQEDQGSKMGDETDGVQALRNFVLERKSKGRRKATYTDSELCGIALTCFEYFTANRTFKTTPRKTDVSKYHPF